MCGIIGYTGPLNAKDVLLRGLEQLEYRGYDSAGIALGQSQTVMVRKQIGSVSSLKESCKDIKDAAHCGIGHTRWATHGGVTDTNAHPHQAGRVTLIHNGIIENYHSILEKYGFSPALVSETDSEVAARLIDFHYHGNPEEAVWAAVKEIKGSYAFCILFSDIPDTVYAIRQVSPMVAAITKDGAFAASDVTALLAYSKEYFILPENGLAVMRRDGIQIRNEEGIELKPELLEVNWNVEDAQKGGYPHFMLKEIHEQPEAIKKTILPRLKNGLPDLSAEKIPDEVWKGCSRIDIVACGTAMYAGMVGKALMEPLLQIPVSVHIASEFRYSNPLIDEKTLMLVISQSGETIDTLAALRLGKEKGATVVSIVNVKGATIARESDYVIYTHAGPEIAVASTKAYSVQLATLYLLGCKMAIARDQFSDDQGRTFMEGLKEATGQIHKVLNEAEQIKPISRRLIAASDAYFIGRGLDYAFSLEGALKLKEISYIHAEAYAAGELKHGTIALIEEGTPVVAIATQDHVFEKMLSNIREVKARGAYVIFITKEGAVLPEGICDAHLAVPARDDIFTGFSTAVYLQLLAYYASAEKGLDVDKPRNLAKSVTVE